MRAAKYPEDQVRDDPEDPAPIVFGTQVAKDGADQLSLLRFAASGSKGSSTVMGKELQDAAKLLYHDEAKMPHNLRVF